MPDNGPETTVATSYPPEELYEQWKDRSGELELSVSDFIIQKVEVGRKQISLDESINETTLSLRRQRDSLQEEVDHLRQRVKTLENELDRTAYGEIEEFIEENPGASEAEIIQHIADSVPNRVVSHLDVMEGEAIERAEDGYYAQESEYSQSDASPKEAKS